MDRSENYSRKERISVSYSLMQSKPIFTFPNPAISRQLLKYNAKDNPPFVEFEIGKWSVDNVVIEANTAADAIKSTPTLLEGIPGLVEASTDVVATTTPIVDTWDPLLRKIKLFTEAVDMISEVRSTLIEYPFLPTMIRIERYTRTQR